MLVTFLAAVFWCPHLRRALLGHMEFLTTSLPAVFSYKGNEGSDPHWSFSSLASGWFGVHVINYNHAFPLQLISMFISWSEADDSAMNLSLLAQEQPRSCRFTSHY